MELKDRITTYPGRVVLKEVGSGVEKTYDVVLADGATQQGTPINAKTLNDLKEEIINQLKSENPAIDTKNLGSTVIKGKLCVNPHYDTEKNAYNEGIRVNQASNGWSIVEVGGDYDSTQDSSQELWLFAKRGVDGSISGKKGDLTIECDGSDGNGLTLYRDGSAPTWQGKKVLLEEMLEFSQATNTLTIKL